MLAYFTTLINHLVHNLLEACWCYFAYELEVDCAIFFHLERTKLEFQGSVISNCYCVYLMRNFVLLTTDAFSITHFK